LHLHLASAIADWGHSYLPWRLQMTRVDWASLDSLLEQHGLRGAWLSLLATNLQCCHEDMAYVLKRAEFAGAEILSVDLLNGLSVTEVGALYEYSLAKVDPHSRKSGGQFFTPDDVAAFMAGLAEQFPHGRWLDPCSGVGTLTWHLAANQEDPEEFLVNSMVVSDRDELALLIARTFLACSFQKKRPRLFDDIERNFVAFDFLSVSDRGNMCSPDSLKRLGRIPSHDFVLMNPPYLRTRPDKHFETAKSADLYAYFLENAIKTSRGLISVTPQSFTNAAKFEDLRALLLRTYPNLTILNFDNIPGNLFAGPKFGSTNSNRANSVRAAITVALPGQQRHRITPLLRWRSSERHYLFDFAETFLSEVTLGSDFFPKVSPALKVLFEATAEMPRLRSMSETKPTHFRLFVPSTPRYFISALKTPAQRASQIALHFSSAEQRDLAYLLINSSLMYWWWRLRDGGMTLSRTTLLSLPVPEFHLDKDLLVALESSESANRTFKVNAGSVQENVKHPPGLVGRLNALICPEFADQLLATHTNSEFACRLPSAPKVGQPLAG
jgi:hypothetical protein